MQKFITLLDYSNLVFSLIGNYQLVAGTATLILENIHGDVSSIKTIWLDNLIKDFQRQNIKLLLRDKFTLTLDRYNDTNVM